MYTIISVTFTISIENVWVRSSPSVCYYVHVCFRESEGERERGVRERGRERERVREREGDREKGWGE